MTDSRLPDSWLNNPEFDVLSDKEWRIFTGALMWSNHRGTDGAIPTRYIRLLHPEGADESDMKGLLDAGLCVKTTDGYQVVNWVELGQSTAAAVEQNRAGSRARAQKQRDLAAEKLAKLTRAKSPAEELGVRRQGRQAGDRKNLHAVGPEAVTEPSPSEETADMRAWDTAVPGSGGLKRVPGSVYDLCTVCGGRLLAPSSMSLGVCDKRDAAHSGTRSVAG